MAKLKEKVYCWAKDARDELRDEGYRESWCISEKPKGGGAERIVSYFINGAGKQVILIETLFPGAERCSWDLYRAVTNSNKVSDTLAELEAYTKAEPQ